MSDGIANNRKYCCVCVLKAVPADSAIGTPWSEKCAHSGGRTALERASRNALGQLEEPAELPCDRTLKIQFREKSLSAFWPSVSTEYPLLSTKAVNILLPFATTYLCETLQTITTFRNPVADPVGTRRGLPLVRGPRFENR